MIQILTNNGIRTPVFACDVCGSPITNREMGMAFFKDPDLEFPERPREVYHAHKGACIDAAEASSEYCAVTVELVTHATELFIGSLHGFLLD